MSITHTAGVIHINNSDLDINVGSGSLRFQNKATISRPAGGGIEVDSIKLTQAVETPTFAAGVLTVDGFQRTYSVHHYEASADITEIAASSNINNGDQVAMSITNTSGSNVQISVGGLYNKGNFDQPANVQATQTCVVAGLKLTGNMHFSVSVFS
jgi:hypothetical protein